MSRDYKLNKSELSRLKRQEKLYGHYLPVLKLKHEQIQLLEGRVKKALAELRLKHEELHIALKPYVALFCDPEGPSLVDLLIIDQIKTHQKSVAGVSIKAFSSIAWREVRLPYFHSAPWLLRALPLLKSYLAIEAELFLLEKEYEILRRELRKATQKVNLFDMVLIPKTRDAIKRIRIALGDEQVASVSRGKIAKAKKRMESL